MGWVGSGWVGRARVCVGWWGGVGISSAAAARLKAAATLAASASRRQQADRPLASQRTVAQSKLHALLAGGLFRGEAGGLRPPRRGGEPVSGEPGGRHAAGLRGRRWSPRACIWSPDHLESLAGSTERVPARNSGPVRTWR